MKPLTRLMTFTRPWGCEAEGRGRSTRARGPEEEEQIGGRCVRTAPLDNDSALLRPAGIPTAVPLPQIEPAAAVLRVPLRRPVLWRGPGPASAVASAAQPLPQRSPQEVWVVFASPNGGAAREPSQSRSRTSPGARNAVSPRGATRDAEGSRRSLRCRAVSVNSVPTVAPAPRNDFATGVHGVDEWLGRRRPRLRPGPEVLSRGASSNPGWGSPGRWGLCTDPASRNGPMTVRWCLQIVPVFELVRCTKQKSVERRLGPHRSTTHRGAVSFERVRGLQKGWGVCVGVVTPT